jgi:hypothetical protein
MKRFNSVHVIEENITLNRKLRRIRNNYDNNLNDNNDTNLNVNNDTNLNDSNDPEHDYYDFVGNNNNDEEEEVNKNNQESSSDESYAPWGTGSTSSSSSSSSNNNNNSSSEEKDNVSSSEGELEDNNIEKIKDELRDNWDEIEQATWDDHNKYDSFQIKNDIAYILNSKYLYVEPKHGIHIHKEVLVNVEDVMGCTDKIYPGSMVSKYEFESKLCSFASKNGLSDSSRMDLLAFLKQILPDGAYVPPIIAKPTESNIMPASSAIQQSNVFVYDICLCGYTVYQGDNMFLHNCPNCKSRRYTGVTDKRYPIATINYHPIIFIICELLENKEFVTALNTCNEDSGKEEFYSDVSDGKVFKKNMKEMSDKHDSYIHNKKIPEEAIKINLALSLQYDGAQVFNYTVSNFWPMLISILNLPPNIRKTLGHGIFLISLFTALSHSSCESFIMSKCLIDELKMLDEGLLIKVNKKLYFIQARLVLHCYDSKALEAICCMHGANSINGCGLCRLSPGYVY